MLNTKEFTIENCLEHTEKNTTIEILKIWKETKHEEEINIFGKSGNEYVLTQIHKDALNPDWNNIDYDLIKEIFLTKRDIKKLQQILRIAK